MNHMCFFDVENKKEIFKRDSCVEFVVSSLKNRRQFVVEQISKFQHKIKKCAFRFCGMRKLKQKNREVEPCRRLF